MSTRNGYLRVGEFRQWADGLGKRLDTIDSSLAQALTKVGTHSELLAVFADRHRSEEEARKAIKKLWVGIITSVAAALITGALELFLHLKH